MGTLHAPAGYLVLLDFIIMRYPSKTATLLAGARAFWRGVFSSMYEILEVLVSEDLRKVPV